VVALSGPSFAAEVAAQQPTAVVAASDDDAASAMVQEALSNTHFRVYTHDDIVGVELGGSLKNVMAVAAGIVEGRRTRVQLARRAHHPRPRRDDPVGQCARRQARHLRGLAGLGDLVLTCTGIPESGTARSACRSEPGATLDEAQAGKETVAEGVTTTRSAHALACSRGSRDANRRHRAPHSVRRLSRAARRQRAHDRELRAEQDA
jgi:glycerol-3-phosphate dehydrogenase (NAD(P)+)